MSEINQSYAVTMLERGGGGGGQGGICPPNLFTALKIVTLFCNFSEFY